LPAGFIWKMWNACSPFRASFSGRFIPSEERGTLKDTFDVLKDLGIYFTMKLNCMN
jgi:hypothetical protein